MPDREKVIKGLQIERECVSRDCDRDCGKCDLVQDRDWLLSVYDGAIAMLKEQEAVKPRVSTVEQRCGNCNKVIEMDGWKACPWCGKPILWEAVGRSVK